MIDLQNSKRRISFAFLLSLACFTESAWAVRKVHVYSGPGADQTCVDGVVNTLVQCTDPKPEIHLYANFRELIRALRNDSEPSILVMPGGSAMTFQVEFARIPLADRQFLRERLRQPGLSYLGICAGAYFASENYVIELSTGGESGQLISNHPERRLGIFSNMHSEFDSFRTTDTAGSQIAPIRLNNEAGSQGSIFWNGGPYIEMQANYRSLASYEHDGRVAIAELDLAEGSRAIVSGIHFEFGLNVHPTLQDYSEHFQNWSRFYASVAILVFQHLGLATRMGNS